MWAFGWAILAGVCWAFADFGPAKSTTPVAANVASTLPITSPPEPSYELTRKTPEQLAADQKARDLRAKERAKQSRKEGVAIGMSEAEVLASSWGKPRKINTTTRARGVHAQWVYAGGYLYFENGILTTVQN